MKKHIQFYCLLNVSIALCGYGNPYINKETQYHASNEQLIVACQIWGFLKYYHPSVSNGNYNWDQELFILIGKLDSNFNKVKTERIFSEWITSLGEVPHCISCTELSNYSTPNWNFDLSWFNQFDDKLKDQLEHIRLNRFQGNHYYFKQSEENFVIEFLNEPEYQSERWIDPNVRLLTLFRYWNYIEYFYPFKYTLDPTWSSTLSNLIPRFLNVHKEQEYHLLLLEMVALINDSHAYFKSDQIKDLFGKKSVPFKIKFVDEKALISRIYNDSLALIDDIKIGDIIIEIDGVATHELLSKNLKYVSGSNKESKLRDIKPFILNGSADSVQLSILRDDRITRKFVRRYISSQIDYNVKPKASWKIIEGNVGYVDMGLLTIDSIDVMMEALNKTKGLIFDLRNYPNGTFNYLCNCINEIPRPFAKVLIADVEYPGKFIWLPFMMNCGTENDKSYNKPIIVLVNEETQSQAEFTAMALSTANDATVIGSKTAGADGNANKFKLPGNFETMFTGIGIYYPDEQQTQQSGIRIDIVITPSLKGISKLQDEVLEYALQYLKEKVD